MLGTAPLRWIMLILLLSSWGCHAPPTLSPSGGPPPDFVLDATILVGSELHSEAFRGTVDLWPAHLRPWRAIVLPDGSLRADSGSEIDVRHRPGITRRLYREQIETLWQVLHSLGLANPDARRGGMVKGNPALLSVDSNEILQILTIAAGGRTWTFSCRFTPTMDDQGQLDPHTEAHGEDPQLRAMLRRLLALAWATDLPPEQRFAAPERYDFGPDPWKRYRSSAEEPSGS